MISTFLVELHLNDVLEVLLVVGSEIDQNYTWRWIPKEYLKKKDNLILYFDFAISPFLIEHQLDDVL